MRHDAVHAVLGDYRNRAIRMLCIAGFSRTPQLSLPLVRPNGAPMRLSLPVHRHQIHRQRTPPPGLRKDQAVPSRRSGDIAAVRAASCESAVPLDAPLPEQPIGPRDTPEGAEPLLRASR